MKFLILCLFYLAGLGAIIGVWALFPEKLWILIALPFWAIIAGGLLFDDAQHSEPKPKDAA